MIRRLILLIGFSGCLLVSCGKEESNTQGADSTANNKNSGNCEMLTPAQAGEKIMAVYHAALSETVTMIKEQRFGNETEAAFDKKLESYQQQLLKIGQHVAAMNPSGKRSVESLVNQGLLRYQMNPELSQLFTDYSKSIFEYSKTHQSLYQKMKSLNIITQFAFFDLLKKQNPDAESKWGKWMKAAEC